VSRGGSWEPDNLLTLCRACHHEKTYRVDRH
jgi:5-methylcytosine-specific restriction endonuclease McrA